MVSRWTALHHTRKQWSPPPPATIGERIFELPHDTAFSLDRNDTENIVSRVNRALHSAGISDIRVEWVRYADTRRLLGVTTHPHPEGPPPAPRHGTQGGPDGRPQHHRRRHPAEADVDSSPQHLPGPYMGKEKGGGLRKLREELGAENSGVYIPAGIRWLGGVKVRARFQEKKDGSSSVLAAVLDEATFNRLAVTGSGSLESDTRSTPMRKHDQMLSVADVADGVTSPPTARPQNPGVPPARGVMPRQTTGAPLRGARWEGAAHALMGRPSVPTAGDPCARAEACTAKREARGAAICWRSPPPPRRERRTAEMPKNPEEETPAAQEVVEGEREVEMEGERGSVQTAMEIGE